VAKTNSNDSGVHFSIDSNSTNTTDEHKTKLKILEQNLEDGNYENGIFNPEFTINDIKVHFIQII